MTEETTSTALELADRFWEGILELDPLLATEVGDERYDDRLPDPSEQGLARRERLHRDALAALETIDRDELDVEAGTAMDVMEAIAHRQLEAIAHRLDRLHAANHLLGPGELLAYLGSVQRADTRERLERYVRRLEGVPDYLAKLGALAREGARLGFTSPALVVDRAVAMIESLVAISPEQSPALRPVAEEDRPQVVEVVRDRVLPAYRDYLQVLRDYRPAARESIAVTALPNGDEIYASQVRAYTTLALDPAEVHRMGLEELERIQDERRRIALALGYRDATAAIREYSSEGRNTARSREELVAIAEEQVQLGWEAAPRYFGRLPRATCEVRPVEEFREKHTPPAFYQPPSADGSRAGVYYINTGDLTGRPLHQLPGITFHEANPGHHFQISLEQEFTDRPRLRRFGGILAGSAFAEGWGLYCERLADEMGLYRNDYERLGMLDAQGWRANRLIVDTGIHTLGWDRDRAIEQMVKAGPPRPTAGVEVDRYIAWPGQALAYKVGQIEIERWRAEASARLGAAFSLREFHDRLLALGSLPLPALRREMADGAAPSD